MVTTITARASAAAILRIRYREYKMGTSADQAFLARWVARYGGDLLSYFRGRVKCPQTAADLTQETLLRLHACGLEQVGEYLNARAFRIAANLLIDHQRKRQVRALRSTGGGRR